MPSLALRDPWITSNEIRCGSTLRSSMHSVRGDVPRGSTLRLSWASTANRHRTKVGTDRSHDEIRGGSGPGIHRGQRGQVSYWPEVLHCTRAMSPSCLEPTSPSLALRDPWITSNEIRCGSTLRSSMHSVRGGLICLAGVIGDGSVPSLPTGRSSRLRLNP